MSLVDAELGSPQYDETSVATDDVSRREIRPEPLNDAEVRAWDYYDSVCDGGDINALYDELISHLTRDSRGGLRAGPSRGQRRSRSTPAYPEPTRGARAEQTRNRRVEPANRHQRKRARYALHQKLWRKSPKALMAELKQPGSSGRNDLPDTVDVARVYGERFGSQSPPDTHAYTPKSCTEAVDLQSFSGAEVVDIMKILASRRRLDRTDLPYP